MRQSDHLPRDDSDKLIQFYLPEQDHVVFPSNIDDYWDWQATSGDISEFWGKYHWVLQTYLYFKKFDIPCNLTKVMPDTGIVISHRDCLPKDMEIIKTRYIICMLVDRLNPCSYANLHIVHNPSQYLKLFKYAYIPPWPQVGLVPRSESRGDIFENIMFYGYQDNLLEELRSEKFQESLARMQLELHIVPPARWNDFSSCDAVLAIRRFGFDDSFGHKPSLKLYNAWLAGVPAILGYENAYHVEGADEFNFLQATSYSEVIDCVGALKGDVALRGKLVANGRAEVKKYLPEVTIKKWKYLLSEVILPGYRGYRNSFLQPQTMRLMDRIRAGLAWRYPLVKNQTNI